MGTRFVYTLLLVAVTAVWGWTFVVVQDAIALYGVLSKALGGGFSFAANLVTRRAGCWTSSVRPPRCSP